MSDSGREFRRRNASLRMHAGNQVSLIERLRQRGDTDSELAAEMLAFFFGQLRSNDNQMCGMASYGFRGNVWPMAQCKGNDKETAVLAVLAAIRQENGVAT